MTKENADPRTRFAAISIIGPILESDIPYRGHIASIAVSQALGLSEEEADQLLAEYLVAKDLNAYPGNIRELPLFDPTEPPTAETIKNELYRRTVWFTLGYVEDVTEQEDNSAIFLGRYWLGNTIEDTKALVVHLQQNPDKVVSFLRWAFENDPSLEDMLDDYTKRAKEGTLRPPSFEE